MVARTADSSRADRDNRGSRYDPPRRNRSRSPARRDRSRDRYGDRFGGSRRSDDRDRDRNRDRNWARDRRDDRRDDHYDGARRDDRRDAQRRRSRSPLRRDRSRERYSDRYRHERNEPNSYRPNSRPTSSRASATPAPDSKRVDREAHKATTEKEQENDRLKKLEAWKKQRQSAKEKESNPGSRASPAGTAPVTPTTSKNPVSDETHKSAKSELHPRNVTEKAKQKPAQKPATKSTFQLDVNAAARPIETKVSGTAVDTNSKNNEPIARHQLQPTGSIGSFGLKKKTVSEEKSATSALLDDGENKGKRKFQALPDFNEEELPEQAMDPDEDAAMGDLGSDNEEKDNAIHLEQLEKRRAEIANRQQNTAEPMDVDAKDKAEAEEDDEEIDPLDAYMSSLVPPEPSRSAPQGQAIFNDDYEEDQTAVDDEDLLSLAAAKKKKKSNDIPVVDHSKIEYEPFRKDFYTEPAEVAQMTKEEVKDLRHELDGIQVKPDDDDVPRPVVKWAQMGLLQVTLDVFSGLGYTKPTSIQAQAIPIAESGRDLIGVAKTGSGKTLAFGIPMIRHILDQRPLKSSDGPIGLILAPTRELALQITTELKPFLQASKLTIKCAYGGQSIADQIAMIKRGGIHVLVATTGRLIDLLASNSGRVLSLKRVTYVVLDEADRMSDMGFEPQVLKILGNVRPDRQTILFSATFPRAMASITRKYLKKPVEVSVGGRSVVASEITQIVTVVENSYEQKIKRLLLDLGKFFQKDENARVLIFVEKQETAEDLLSKLFKAQYSAVNTIHGAKDQTDRNEAINDFKQGVLSILIATSVAARGLDVPGLQLVYNFDCPTHLEDYVHRCGRTGRAGTTGTAMTLIEKPGQENFALHIAKALKESKTEVPQDLQEMADSFYQKVKSGEAKIYGGFGGKGLDKLDAARAMEKKSQRRALKLEDDDESEEEEEVPGIKPLEISGPGPANTNTTSAAEPPPEQPAYMRELDKQIIVNKSERPAASTQPSAAMTAKERAMLAAKRIDGNLSKKGTIHAGQPIDNKGPDAGLYHATLEINDFPQKARWAVTNRTNVARILDTTGVSITTKGNYYPPGKEPGEDELPKLYILVEGDTEHAVVEAIKELQRHLRDGTLAEQESSATRATGRYNVL